MRVLIIDNNIDRDFWGSGELRDFVLKHQTATCFVRRGPNNDFPKTIRGYDKLIVSGSKTSCLDESPWITRLDELIRETLDAGIPYLGVCYGHQSLNRVLGGREILLKDAIPEYGWTKIERIVDNPLFEGLPETFYTYSSHLECVTRLPRGMKHLARSRDCEIQACQLEDRPVWGVQFHPERGLERGERTLRERIRDGKKEGILHPGEGPRLYDAQVGEKIFGNFLRA